MVDVLLVFTYESFALVLNAYVDFFYIVMAALIVALVLNLFRQFLYRSRKKI